MTKTKNPQPKLGTGLRGEYTCPICDAGMYRPENTGILICEEKGAEHYTYYIAALRVLEDGKPFEAVQNENQDEDLHQTLKSIEKQAELERLPEKISRAHRDFDMRHPKKVEPITDKADWEEELMSFVATMVDGGIYSPALVKKLKAFIKRIEAEAYMEGLEEGSGGEVSNLRKTVFK